MLNTLNKILLTIWNVVINLLFLYFVTIGMLVTFQNVVEFIND